MTFTVDTKIEELEELTLASDEDGLELRERYKHLITEKEFLFYIEREQEILECKRKINEYQKKINMATYLIERTIDSKLTLPECLIIRDKILNVIEDNSKLRRNLHGDKKGQEKYDTIYPEMEAYYTFFDIYGFDKPSADCMDKDKTLLKFFQEKRLRSIHSYTFEDVNGLNFPRPTPRKYNQK